MIYQLHDPSVAGSLFAGWPDTMVLSCLQGVMGRIYADNMDTPCCAMAILGDFCFFSGTPNRELVTFKPEYCTQDFIIMVPHNDAWARLIEDVYGDRAAKTTRYAIKKEGMIFDPCKLQSFIDALPQGYALHQIDESLYHDCRSCQALCDFVSQFDSYEQFAQMGVGYVVQKDGVPVSGASSYTVYQGGIEIQVCTLREYRRQGLALAAGAALIQECMTKRHIYPSWDAHNPASVALAEKLGYHFSHPYTVYEIHDY